jgi:hypothetical protein
VRWLAEGEIWKGPKATASQRRRAPPVKTIDVRFDVGYLRVQGIPPKQGVFAEDSSLDRSAKK